LLARISAYDFVQLSVSRETRNAGGGEEKFVTVIIPAIAREELLTYSFGDLESGDLPPELHDHEEIEERPLAVESLLGGVCSLFAVDARPKANAPLLTVVSVSWIAERVVRRRPAVSGRGVFAAASDVRRQLSDRAERLSLQDGSRRGRKRATSAQLVPTDRE
jgi:hypothetical protein